MEMTLNLTFEDGLKVVEAMKKVALEHGWDTELSECNVIEEYSRVIDAALNAMGINIRIDANPSYEDEDEDFNDEGFDFDFDDEEDDEEDNDDNAVYSLTVKGDFALRYMEAGHTFEEACEIADLLFGKGE